MSDEAQFSRMPRTRFPYPIANRKIARKAVGLTLAAVFLPGSAAAQQADLSSCLAIGDIEDRVACYDAIARGEVVAPEAGPMQAAPPEPETPPIPVEPAPVEPAPVQQAPASPASVAREAPISSFGLSAAEREALRNPDQNEPNELFVDVVAAHGLGAGYWRFELADGTIWELAETRRTFRPPKAGDTIRIRRGALGAFYLDVDRQPVIRIKRVV